MGDCIPLYEPGQRLTCEMAATVAGQAFVKVSADAQGTTSWPGLSTNTDGNNIICNVATAGGRALGVLAYDVASGDKGSIICGGVVPLIAEGSISAFGEIEVGTGGLKAKAKSAGGQSVGVALHDAGDGETVYCMLGGLGAGGGGEPGSGNEYAQGTAAAAPTVLTDSTGGTADGTVSAVGATNSGDVSATINNNFKEVLTTLTAIRTALLEYGIWT